MKKITVFVRIPFHALKNKIQQVWKREKTHLNYPDNHDRPFFGINADKT